MDRLPRTRSKTRQYSSPIPENLACEISDATSQDRVSGNRRSGRLIYIACPPLPFSLYVLFFPISLSFIPLSHNYLFRVLYQPPVEDGVTLEMAMARGELVGIERRLWWTKLLRWSNDGAPTTGKVSKLYSGLHICESLIPNYTTYYLTQASPLSLHLITILCNIGENGTI